MKTNENFNTIELSINEMEQANGGSLVAAAIGAAVAVTIFAWKVCWDMGAAYRE
jgi:hypothetical protein